MIQSKILISLVLTGLLFLAAFGGASGSHIRHLISPPADLYEPIVVDNFPFWEKGTVRNYSLKPKYMDTYEIGLLSTNGTFLSKEKFSGKVKVEFFCEGKKIKDDEIVAFDRKVYADDCSDMTRLKSATFITFDVPVSGKYKEDLSVQFTVVNNDQNLKRYESSLRLYIAVSASP